MNPSLSCGFDIGVRTIASERFTGLKGSFLEGSQTSLENTGVQTSTMTTMDWFKAGDGNTLKSWGEVEREKARMRRERAIQEAFDRKARREVEPETAHQVTGSATDSESLYSRPVTPPSPPPAKDTIEERVQYIGPANPLQPLPSTRKHSVPTFSWPNYHANNSSTSSLPSSSRIRGRTLFRLSRRFGRDKALDSNDVIRGKISPHVSPRTTFKPREEGRHSIDSATSPHNGKRRPKPRIWLSEARIPIPLLPSFSPKNSDSRPGTPTETPFDQGIKWNNFFQTTSRTESPTNFPNLSPKDLPSSGPLSPAGSGSPNPTPIQSAHSSRREKLKSMFRRAHRNGHEEASEGQPPEESPSSKRREAARKALRPLRGIKTGQSVSPFEFPLPPLSTSRKKSGNFGSQRLATTARSTKLPRGTSQLPSYFEDDINTLSSPTSPHPSAPFRGLALRKASTRSDSATLARRGTDYTSRDYHSQGSVSESRRISEPTIASLTSRSRDDSYVGSDSQPRFSVASQGSIGGAGGRPTSITIPSVVGLPEANLIISPFEEHPGNPWEDQTTRIHQRFTLNPETDSQDSSFTNAPPSLNAPPLSPAIYRNPGGFSFIPQNRSVSPFHITENEYSSTQLIGPMSNAPPQPDLLHDPTNSPKTNFQLLSSSPSQASARSHSSRGTGHHSQSSNFYNSSTAATTSTSREKVREKTKVL